jgi:hypothetical protein
MVLRLVPLPVSTFGEIAALGLEVRQSLRPRATHRAAARHCIRSPDQAPALAHGFSPDASCATRSVSSGPLFLTLPTTDGTGHTFDGAGVGLHYLSGALRCVAHPVLELALLEHERHAVMVLSGAGRRRAEDCTLLARLVSSEHKRRVLFGAARRWKALAEVARKAKAEEAWPRHR